MHWIEWNQIRDAYQINIFEKKRSKMVQIIWLYNNKYSEQKLQNITNIAGIAKFSHDAKYAITRNWNRSTLRVWRAMARAIAYS